MIRKKAMDEYTKKLHDILIDEYHNVLLMEETKRKYSSAGFSFRDRNAVAFICKYKDGINISNVADYLKITRPSASVLIKKLEKYGLIERKTSPKNNRNIIVKVTRKGRLFSRYQQRYYEKMVERISEELTDEEREILYKGMLKLNELFVESIEESNSIHEHK